MTCAERKRVCEQLERQTVALAEASSVEEQAEALFDLKRTIEGAVHQVRRELREAA